MFANARENFHQLTGFPTKMKLLVNNANSHCHILQSKAYALASIMLVVKTDFLEILTIFTGILPTKKKQRAHHIFIALEILGKHKNHSIFTVLCKQLHKFLYFL